MSNSKRKCRALMKEFILDNTQLHEISRRFLNELNRGLCKRTHEHADVKCFVTYVQDLPTGQEIGKYMALDLGGTNFRVLLVTLKAHHEAEIEAKAYAISQEIMTGPGVDLFDHIAECLAKFMMERDLLDQHLQLGFTFSFPLKQYGLTKGHLIRWTKGFNCPGVENEDVVQLLNDALNRRGDLSISVVGILNDTTGTLMSCAHRNKNCHIGVIIGTGCNACYLERVENVDLFESRTGKPYVIVNAEMGAFGESGSLDFIRTEYDRTIDRSSLNPSKQIYEKMISGMYMGEIVRLILLKAIEMKLILTKQKPSQRLAKRESFETRFISEIESDREGEYTNCKKILNLFGFIKPSNDDCAEVRYICECVSQRAAHLVACSQATIINKINERHTTVGVDGTVYRLHPRFSEHMKEKMKELVNPKIGFDLMLSEDGSGRGAALVAATVVA